MIQLRGFLVAVIMIGATISRPANAQSRGASSSVTHVVSVSVPARVKVKVSSIAMMSSRSIPAAVGVRAGSSGLALTVNANQAWVLSASGLSGSPKAGLHWSGTRSAEITALGSGDGESTFSRSSSQPVLLTVSAP